jgi:ACS family D-galactonate transporter-like MFS transporter
MSEQKVPNRRWRTGALLGFGVLANYLDRLNLSVAAPQLQQAFHLSPGQVGLFLSAFFWSYALSQVPSGVLLDRIGPTRIGRWSAFLWGIASLITALAGGFGGILAARILLGVAEAPGFPLNAKVTGYWFPRQERALATAIFDAAAKFSNVIGIPLIACLVVGAGWRWGFGLTAALSFIYFAAFFVIYRDPSKDPGLSRVEYRYILEGGATPEGHIESSSMGMLGYLLTKPKMWALIVGFAAYGYTFYLLLTWLPSYLVQIMHVTILRSASYAAIPWAVATVADLLVGGWLIDRLVTGGYDQSRVRKTVLVGGMTLGLSIFGVTLTANPSWAILWISLALGGLAAAAPVCWSLPSLIAPKAGVGSVGSLMNLSNNLMGGAAPIVTGYIVGATKSFTMAFLLAGAFLVIGIVSFVVVLGEIEPIPDLP